MAYNEKLVERVRAAIGKTPNLTEKKMFGSLSFLINGNMAVGVINDDLVIRMSEEDQKAASDKPHVTNRDFMGRPIKGWIFVAPDGIGDDKSLAAWVKQGVDHAKTLPAK